MAQPESKADYVNYNELAEGIDAFREIIRAFVAGLVGDGFTEREARALIAGFWAARIPKNGEDDDNRNR